jgi:hypothetical protein
MNAKQDAWWRSGVDAALPAPRALLNVLLVRKVFIHDVAVQGEAGCWRPGFWVPSLLLVRRL